MLPKGSKHLINLVPMSSKSNTKPSKFHENDEHFQSFTEINSFQEIPTSTKKLTISKLISSQVSAQKNPNKESTNYSNSFPPSRALSRTNDISKNKKEKQIVIIPEKERSESIIKDDYEEEDYLFLSKFDLTNRLLDLLKQHYWAIPFWVFLTLVDSILRINTMTYFFYKLIWISEYYYVYLTFFCVCRAVYALILVKLLFQSEFEDMYIERIANNFALNDEGAKVLFFNKSIDYDFEFNLDPKKEKFRNDNCKTFKKNSRKMDCRKTSKMIGIRLILIFFPNELCFFVAKILYGETQFSLLISILCGWFFKSVEIYTIIPFLAIFYYYEEWKIGFNYDFISLILLLIDVCKTLLTIVILFLINKRRTRSKSLFFLATKK